MEISPSTLPAVAAERATMFVALELSKSSWLVALHSPVADRSACMTRHPLGAVGAEPGRTWTGSPQGSDCRQKDGSRPPRPRDFPKHAGCGSRLRCEPTGYKVMRGFSANRPGEADPEFRLAAAPQTIQ